MDYKEVAACAVAEAKAKLKVNMIVLVKNAPAFVSKAEVTGEEYA